MKNMKLKNINVNCKFSMENWQFLNEESDRLEMSVSAVLRRIIRRVFENKQYLQNIVYDTVEKNKATFKNTTLTITDSSFEKLNKIVYERNDNCLNITSRYYADYVVSAYIKLIEADLIKI